MPVGSYINISVNVDVLVVTGVIVTGPFSFFHLRMTSNTTIVLCDVLEWQCSVINV